MTQWTTYGTLEKMIIITEDNSWLWHTTTDGILRHMIIMTEENLWLWHRTTDGILRHMIIMTEDNWWLWHRTTYDTLGRMIIMTEDNWSNLTRARGGQCGSSARDLHQPRQWWHFWTTWLTEIALPSRHTAAASSPSFCDQNLTESSLSASLHLLTSCVHKTATNQDWQWSGSYAY